MASARAVGMVVLVLLAGAASLLDAQERRSAELDSTPAVRRATSLMGLTDLLNGTFVTTDMVDRNASLTLINAPAGVIGPNLTHDTPSWTYYDDFTSGGSGTTPPGWSCSGKSWNYSSSALRMWGEEGGDHTWCEDTDLSSWITNDKITISSEMWIEQLGEDPEFGRRGAKFGGWAEGRPLWFVVTENQSGETTVMTSDGGTINWYCRDPQHTAMPSENLSAEWHDWRLIAELDGELLLYQDGILRCRRAMWTNIPSSGQRLQLGVGGGNNDGSRIHYDSIAVKGGFHQPFHGGSWTSPILSTTTHEWGSIELDWWMPGIGTFDDDVARAVRLTIIDVDLGVPLGAYTDLIPTEDGALHTSLNISDIDATTPIRLKLTWLDERTDWVGVHNISFADGPQLLPNLHVANITFPPPASGHIRAGSPVSVAVGLELTGPTPAPGTITSALVVDGATRALHDEGLTGWPAGKVWQTQLPAMTTGEHEVVARVDVQGNLSEGREDDNERAVMLKVHPATGPVLDVSGPILDVVAGEPFAINVESSVDGLSITTLHVDWGDGQESNYSGGGPIGTTHAWDPVWTFTVTMWADLAGGFVSANTTLSVTTVNRLPQAVITVGQHSSSAGDFVEFSCADSIDTTGDDLDCLWITNDGGGGTSPILFHAFDQPGLYLVMLTVTDTHGASNTTSMEWFVTSDPASGTVLGLLPAEQAVHEGDEVDVRVVWNPLSTPVDRSVVQLTWRADGSALQSVPQGNSTWRLTMPTESEGGRVLEVQLDSYWVDVGTPITDRDLVSFNLSNRAPVADASVSDDIVEESAEVVIDWSTSSDDPWDEAALVASVEPAGGILQTINATRFGIVWESPGVKNVTLNVTDGDGASSWLTLSVTVDNVDPTVSITCFPTIGLNLSATCTVASVNDTAADLAGLTYAWEWGDETADDDEGPIVEHAFSTGGTYTVSLTVTDDQGRTGTDQASITVLSTETPDDGLLGAVGLVVLLLVVILLLLLLLIMRGGEGDAAPPPAHPFEQSAAVEMSQDLASPPVPPAPAAPTPIPAAPPAPGIPPAPSGYGASPAPPPGAFPAAPPAQNMPGVIDQGVTGLEQHPMRQGVDGDFVQAPDGYWYRGDGYGGFDQQAYHQGQDGLFRPHG